jgi:pimeloyl-ACP methyl ester carboxylesterase
VGSRSRHRSPTSEALAVPGRHGRRSDRPHPRAPSGRDAAPAARGEGWQHGASIDYLERFRAYWLEEFDWAAAQDRLNAHPQFTVEIDGLRIHFYWVRGSARGSRPLLLTHGWPGSIVEFQSVIDALAHPEEHGGDGADSFDVVVPSLPGFGFSGRPEGVLGPQSTARLWRRLMVDVLGYERFGAQGGDLGSMVTAYLGGEHSDVVSAIHLNFVPIRPVPDLELSPAERAWKANAGAFRALELDYFTLQEHRPQTLAVALHDSSLGAAAWMLERLNSWSDGGLSAFRIDDLITNLMLYVATGRIESSLWFYRSFLLECEGRTHPSDRVEVPTGVAVSPKEMLNGRPPRSWVERDYRLVHWSVMPRGGHFACLEQPELFVRDVRDFFRGRVAPARRLRVASHGMPYAPAA